MESTARLLEAVSTLMWPLIVIAIVLVFRPTVAALMDSARSREFTLKVGGQELTMGEANQQQRDLIADLQAQVAELRKRVDGGSINTPVAIAPAESVTLGSSAVLWVDDNPKNNSYFVDRLQKLGVKVDLATSTSEALTKLARGRYSLIISDMGRDEDGRANATAGLDLLRNVQELASPIPLIVFCSATAARKYRDQAMGLGAVGITSSATELFGLLHLEELSAG